jgi:hypothetical protein
MYSRVELISMRNALMENSMEWFDPRAGHDEMDAHAWRAIAYFLAGTKTENEEIQRSNHILATHILRECLI